MANTSRGGESTDALNGKLAFEQSKNRIVGRDEDNLIRLLIQASGDQFNMKVAKEGFDAANAEDDELVFNSDQNVFKIVEIGTGSVTVPPTSGSTAFSTTIHHNLGYVPIPWVFVNNAGHYSPTPFPLGISANGLFVGFNGMIFATADATNLYVTVFTGQSGGNPSVNGTFTFKYYLLQETAN